MKTKIYKLLAVGLTVALVASLMAFAAPVSARVLGWSSEIIPSPSNQVIEPGVEVTDIAVAEDGVTIFATNSSNLTFKSTDRGVKWSEIDLSLTAVPPGTWNTGNKTDLVAVAPDDTDMIVVADSDTCAVFITTNGGTTWNSLGTPPIGGLDVINDLAISAASAGMHYIAIAGDDGGRAEVHKYNAGHASPSWTDASALAGFSATSANTTAAAIAYSPNFPSDNVLLCVTAYWDGTTTGSDYVKLEIFSENLDKWNVDAAFSDYPGAITDDDGITGVTAASLALGPDYLGSDEAMRLAYIGLTLETDGDKNGIHRMVDVVAKELKIGDVVKVNSVAYDGAVLVAGKHDNNTVYYSLDPTTTTPTVTPTTTLKRPGGYGTGADKVVLAWAGADVVAGVSTTGAFAVSTNNGKSFNDISLIASPLTDLSDVAVSPDGSNVYLMADDGTITSVWRKAGSWERVLAVTGGPFIVRIAPDDPEVVYIAEKNATAIYYTSDAGDTRWQIRTCNIDVVDLAVEGDGTVAYALTAGGKVSKSSNGGFTWSHPVVRIPS
jgi:hypothetical protein